MSTEAGKLGQGIPLDLGWDCLTSQYDLVPLLWVSLVVLTLYDRNSVLRKTCWSHKRLMFCLAGPGI